MRPAVDRICHDSKTMQRSFVFQVKSIYCEAWPLLAPSSTPSTLRSLPPPPYFGANTGKGTMEIRQAFSYAHSTHVHVGHIVASVAHIHIAVAHHVVCVIHDWLGLFE